MVDPNADAFAKRNPAAYVIAAGAAIGMIGVGMAIAGLPILGPFGSLAIIGMGCAVSTCGIIWKNKLDMDAFDCECSMCEGRQNKVVKALSNAMTQVQEYDPSPPHLPLKMSSGKGRSQNAQR